MGKGLSELLGEHLLPESEKDTTGAQQIRMIPVTNLKPGKYQPRNIFDKEKLESLASSIKEKGVLQPILVRDVNGIFEIVAGERRWRAAQMIGLTEVPVLLQTASDQESLEMGLIENIQRADLTPIEEGLAYKRLIEQFSYTQEELSKKIGKSRSHIANTIRLLSLPEQVQRYISDGKLSAGHARALVGHEQAQTIAELAIQKGMNVRQLEVYMSRPHSAEPANTNNHDPDQIHIERQLSQLLGFKTSLRLNRQGGGIIEIAFKDMSDIDSLMQILMKMRGYAA